MNLYSVLDLIDGLFLGSIKFSILQYLKIGLFGFIGSGLGIALYKNINRYNRKYELLKALGIFEKDFRVNEKEYGIELTGVQPKFLNRTYWRDNFEILSNIFDQKFIDVKIISSQIPVKVSLYFDQLPESIDYINHCPELSPMETWVGKNQFNENVIINLQDSPSVYLDGRPGSGKTIALMSLFEGYFRGVKENAELIVVTTKPADFYKLKSRSDSKVKIIDPFEGDFKEQISKIIYELLEIKKLETLFKEIIRNNPKIETSQMNLEEVRKLGITDIGRKFFIFDEAKDYLSKEKSDSKEEGIAKQELVKAVHTHIRRTARFLSIPIIIASQTQTESDLDIPLKSFSLRLASSTSDTMSKIIAGDKRLADLSFKKGKFYLKSEKEEHIVRVPILN